MIARGFNKRLQKISFSKRNETDGFVYLIFVSLERDISELDGAAAALAQRVAHHPYSFEKVS
jgi:hypothetical protein